VSEYTGLSFAEFTSVGVGQVMEFYINFGRPGVLIGFACLGVLLRTVDFNAARCLLRKQYADFAFWYLPGLAFMQTGGSLVEISGTCATSAVLALLTNKIGLPMVLRVLRHTKAQGGLETLFRSTSTKGEVSRAPTKYSRRLHSARS
jgi:hypothetical protein